MAAIEEKYIGLALAILSSLAIGASFVITKKGLNETATEHGTEGVGFKYLSNPIWWAGIATMGIGEVANFAAYAFAPAILVTPLGALSVLIGAVLGAYFLNEELGRLGKLGCGICLIGSLIIVLHAPPDEEVQTVDEILHYAIKPGFLTYCALVAAFSSVMIYKVAPKYGKSNPLIYLSICSTVGSVSVMSIKAFGIALKLTAAGSNQFSHPSTYVFVIVVVVCVLTQMNYFNKALSQFSTSIVNPIYYVMFTTFTLTASCILFQGFNTSDKINTISLLAGFLIIFSGVYLLDFSRSHPNGARSARVSLDAVATDGLTAISSRSSMQANRSRRNTFRPNESLMRAYDEENDVGLEDIDSGDEGEIDDRARLVSKSMAAASRELNGNGTHSRPR